MEKIFETKIQKQTMSCIKEDKTYYLLNQSGDIVDSNGEKLKQLGGSAWSCLVIIGEKEMVAGSFTGSLAFISLWLYLLSWYPNLYFQNYIIIKQI